MENMKVEIISKDVVKPSSSTSSELREFKLSLLDQSAPSSYTPLIFFYTADQLQTSNLAANHREICLRLKKSLSETLTHYFPVAGTLIEAYLIECNDAGIEFSEARVSWNLTEIMEKSDVQILQRLLPFDPSENRSENRSVNQNRSDNRSENQNGSENGSENGLENGIRDWILGVRYNVFECGGVAIAMCITHKIVDGITAVELAKNWAGVCRGVTEFEAPTFDSVKMFPAIEIRGQKHRVPLDKIETRRFVFNKSSLAALKKQVNSGGFSDDERPPSRVEAVSAFLWKRLMALSQSRETKAKRFAALHAVNLRGRMDPPLPQSSFGNLWWFAVAEAPIEEENSYKFLVSEIRKAIKEIDGDYVKNTLQNPENCMRLKMKLGQLVYSGELELCNFSSWCRFPVYEADFGWGKPVWFCSPGRPYKNVVVLIHTSDGEGIEAWVNLDKNDMSAFETDPEVLSFASSSN